MKKRDNGFGSDISWMLSGLEKTGLADVGFKGNVKKLMTVPADNVEVLYWKTLAFLVGTLSVHRDLRSARQLLDKVSENNEPRFQMLRGILAMAESEGKDIDKLQMAESCFVEASTCEELRKEVLYCLGKCRFALLIAKCDLDLENGPVYKIDSENKGRNVLVARCHPSPHLSSPEYQLKVEKTQLILEKVKDRYRAEGGGERIAEWRKSLQRACQDFYDSYRLGSVEALIEIARCIHANDHLNGWAFRLINTKSCKGHSFIKELRVPEFEHAYQCYKVAAGHGLAEGWGLWEQFSVLQSEPWHPTSDIVDEQDILAAWIDWHNVSRAYSLSLKYNQEDALVHYIAGVVHECGLCGFDKDGMVALKEFEKAQQSDSDVLGFVKDLAKDHLMHIGCLKGYESNFHPYVGAHESKAIMLKYLEYWIERGKTDVIYDRQDKKCLLMRKFRWWYSLGYVLAHLSCYNWRDMVCAEKRRMLAQKLLDSDSPEGLFLMSRLDLYEVPLKIKANAKWNNELNWLKYATVFHGGSSDANYWLAKRLIEEKSSLAFASRGRLIDAEESLYNSEIVRKLETASLCGHQRAEFEILMAARYGNSLGIEKSPEEIANGFLQLSRKGYREAGYEYAFCQYDQFGVTCDIEDCYAGISAAACVYHGYGRGRAIYEKIWGHTYWGDLDRGCQEI